MPDESRPFKYEITYKREATKGIDGFTVTARDDYSDIAESVAQNLYHNAKNTTKTEEVK